MPLRYSDSRSSSAWARSSAHLECRLDGTGPTTRPGRPLAHPVASMFCAARIALAAKARTFSSSVVRPVAGSDRPSSSPSIARRAARVELETVRWSGSCRASAARTRAACSASWRSRTRARCARRGPATGPTLPTPLCTPQAQRPLRQSARRVLFDPSSGGAVGRWCRRAGACVAPSWQ